MPVFKMPRFNRRGQQGVFVVLHKKIGSKQKTEKAERRGPVADRWSRKTAWRGSAGGGSERGPFVTIPSGFALLVGRLQLLAVAAGQNKQIKHVHTCIDTRGGSLGAQDKAGDFHTSHWGFPPNLSLRGEPRTQGGPSPGRGARRSTYRKLPLRPLGESRPRDLGPGFGRANPPHPPTNNRGGWAGLGLAMSKLRSPFGGWAGPAYI